jgi:hypothetical protein
MSRPLIGLACLCDQCGGREALLTSPRWRSLNRLPFPTRERVSHLEMATPSQAVNGEPK